MAGGGVGGGSLNYANTLYRAAERRSSATRSGRGITDWEAELAPVLRPGEPDARRHDATRRRPRPTRSCARSPRRWASATRSPHPGRRLLRRARGRRCADPYFGGAGPERTGCIECGACMTGCRVRRQEHAGEELPVPGREGRRGGAPAHHGDRSPAPGGRLGGRHGAQRRAGRERTVRRLDLRPGRARRGHARHAAAAARHARRRHACPGSRRGWATRPAPTPRRCSAPPARTEHASTTARAWPSRRRSTPTSTPTRAGALRQGQQRHRPAADRAGRRRRPAAALAEGARRHRRHPRGVRPQPLGAPLVGAHRHRAGHAEPRQQHHRHRPPREVRRLGALTSRPGPGEPNPTWIPGGHEAARRIADEIGGVPGGAFTDLVDIPMTAHFLGGCAIGADAGDRASSTPTTGCTATRPHGRRRLGGLGEPGREPLADHHRAGRAGDGAVAQQGRGRRPARARRGLPAGRARPAAPSRRAGHAPGALRLLPLTVVQRSTAG